MPGSMEALGLCAHGEFDHPLGCILWLLHTVKDHHNIEAVSAAEKCLKMQSQVRVAIVHSGNGD